MIILGLIGFLIVVVLILVIPSLRHIGQTEVGLVSKRFGFKKLPEDNPIAFNGEPGYQDYLLMPGLRFKFWVLYGVQKFPWVQVPAGEIGVVISQVGQSLPIGAKSAVYKKEFGNFSGLKAFIENGGQKGVQRPVISPGTLIPIHPVAFLVITKRQVYGIPVDPNMKRLADREGRLGHQSFGLREEQLNVVRIEPHGDKDMVGIITVLEGDPLPSGDIASRLGGFEDIEKIEKDRPMAIKPENTEKLEKDRTIDAQLIDAILGSKNHFHNNYQDFQAFLTNGGKIGLQHDPLLYGAYNLNPFLISVELVPMLVVQQGEVAVIKSYVGLSTMDISGKEFKFGSIVKPGHRGVWSEPLRTGKYPINPRCYQAVIVPTYILTLNWADATSKAHELDSNLQPIEAKSREGFVFKVDLQVQIHVPDTDAPRLISAVGTMRNLVEEVLQAAVGNHFRDKLQSMPAIRFIETRQEVQEEALAHIKEHLAQYHVETKGVYIQDVVLPEQLVTVLTQREIANQEIETFKKQKEAQDQRITMENAKGVADMQSQLAQSKVGVDIKTNNAQARIKEAEGEASYISQIGQAKGVEPKAVGLANAEAYEAQVKALGPTATTVVNAIRALAEGKVKIIPDILVAGGNSGSLEGLAATLTKFFTSKTALPETEKKTKKE